MPFEQFLSHALNRALADETAERDNEEFAGTRERCRRGVVQNWKDLTSQQFLQQVLWCVGSQSRKYWVHDAHFPDQLVLFRGCDSARVVSEAAQIRTGWAARKSALRLEMVESVIAVATKIEVMGWAAFRAYYLALPANPETESAADWQPVLDRLSTFDRVKWTTAWYLLRNCLGARVFKPDVHIWRITERFFGPNATPDVELVEAVHQHWPAVCQDPRLLPVHIGEVDYVLWWDAQASAAGG